MTAKISAIIAQYIGQEIRLIIPEVGTLIRRKESGEIIFMDMLKKNDGTLVQLIVNAMDVSPSKATEITNRYIGTVKQQLESNKKFIIDGVGVLLARPDGKIDFSFNPFAKSLPEPTPVAKPASHTVARPVSPIPPVQRPAAPAPQPAPQPKPAAPVQPKPATPVQPAPQPKPAAPVQPKKVEAEAPKKAEVEAPKKVEAEAPKRPAEQVAKGPKRPAPKKPAPKVDLLTVFAIVAAVIALITLIWGFSAPSYDNAPVEEFVQPTTLDEAIDSKTLYQG